MEEVVVAAEEAPVKKVYPKRTELKKMAEPSAGDFDWDNAAAKGFGDDYSSKEKEEMAQVYGDTLTTITEKEGEKGIIV